MPDSDDLGISPELLETLLNLPTRDEQSAFLHSKALFSEDGLLQLLDEASYLAGNDPGMARRLAVLCEDLAESASAPILVPRAMYIRAQTHAINADYETALDLIASAREGYKALGRDLDSLRTNLGLIHVLQEIGRYEEALDAGRMILDALEDVCQPETAASSPERGQIAATAYQNTGRCYEQMGRYDDALKAYASAEALYFALEMTDRIGDISNNRGIVLLNLGRGQEALSAFEKASSIFAEAGETLYHAQAQINIGDACLLLGSYTRGLESFEHARHLLAPLEALADKHVLLLDMADAYLTLNLYAEALDAYREADGLLLSAGMTHDRARALWGMGSALIAQLHYEEADQVLTEAEDLFSTANNIPMLSNVILERASLLAARGDHDGALSLAKSVLGLVSDGDWTIQQVYAHLRLADLLLPDTDAALIHLLDAQKLSDRLALPNIRSRLNQRLGHLNLLSGHLDDAQILLEKAVGEFEQMRGVLRHEMARTSFLRDKTAVYEDLIQLHLAREGNENVEQAFAVVERAKSRTLVDLLTGIVDARAEIPADLELAGRLQLSQTELNSIYNELLSSDQKANAQEIFDRAVKLEREISRMHLQAAGEKSQAPDQFDPLLPPVSLTGQFPDDAILLTYYICGDEVLAFVKTGGRLQVARHICRVSSVQGLLQKLALQWDRFRAGSDFIAKHLGQFEQSTQRILKSLYDELMAPIENMWGDFARDQVSKLVVVPHGALHQVPFHALFDGSRYLIDRFEISHAPSLTVWTLCQNRMALDKNKALLIGVADELIPAAETEVRVIAQHLDNVSVHTDKSRATLNTFLTESPECGILHLACHGLFRADNPMFSALKLQDGWLRAADVMQLDLAGALVTLSACESGRSRVIPGDEIIGLVRAFLGAGASTLVVSLWLVHDETTVTLMETWYAQLKAGASRGGALRAAQLAVKAAHPHPYYWAPFVLMGRG